MGVVVAVEPGGGGQSEPSSEYVRGDACRGASAVAFEAEQGFEGLVGWLDDLAQRRKKL